MKTQNKMVGMMMPLTQHPNEYRVEGQPHVKMKVRQYIPVYWNELYMPILNGEKICII